MARMGIQISMMSLPWFLCLSIGYTSMEVSLRILDLFFYFGVDVLFCGYLALFEVKQEKILQLRDPEMLNDLLRDFDYDCDALIQVHQ
jgi:uncharacterized membrane protein YgdD (TMEM256/DUF423 family)